MNKFLKATRLVTQVILGDTATKKQPRKKRKYTRRKKK